MKGYAIRDEMNGVEEPEGKTWFWELEAAVVNADRCVQCGTCVAVCPSNSIGVNLFTNLPELVKMCTGCSLCWDFCPRAGLRYEATWHAGGTAPSSSDAREPSPDERADLGAVRERVSVRARRRAPRVQDGGAVTAILSALLEDGAIDAAVVAAPREGGDDPRARAVVATTPAGLAAASGSAYHQTMALGALDLPLDRLPSSPKVAVVGTPCEIQGLRAMQLRPWSTGAHRVEAVVLTIALLCTKSFDYERLYHHELRDGRGVSIRSLRRIDVTRGRLVVEDELGVVVDEPVSAFRGAALKGCEECADFLGRAADLAVGSIGSAPGWSTVLARTDAGLDALRRSHHALDVRSVVATEPLLALDAANRRRATAALARPLDEDAGLFISVDDHLAAYAGSDRAPVVVAR